MGTRTGEVGLSEPIFVQNMVQQFGQGCQLPVGKPLFCIPWGVMPFCIRCFLLPHAARLMSSLVLADLCPIPFRPCHTAEVQPSGLLLIFWLMLVFTCSFCCVEHTLTQESDCHVETILQRGTAPLYTGSFAAVTLQIGSAKRHHVCCLSGAEEEGFYQGNYKGEHCNGHTSAGTKMVTPVKKGDDPSTIRQLTHE